MTPYAVFKLLAALGLLSVLYQNKREFRPVWRGIGRGVYRVVCKMAE